jgi:6-phosphogluconolactonase/glucosamine-6-phosphate isomerase/deaminase
VEASLGRTVQARVAGENHWLRVTSRPVPPLRPQRPFSYTQFPNETAVGSAMFDELTAFAREKSGYINIVLLGGRGAQAMYGKVRELAERGEIDELLGRLNVFTQDALAPMRMDNSLSFVRDFERLLGPAFFEKVNSFTPMQTDSSDLEGELVRYVQRIEGLGGIDLFFLGLGPEANDASHLCYIKPGCGAALDDFAGIIPISSTILEHHISKFKIGGSQVNERDESECREARYILTLGPAAILGAKRIVQSIVDASTAPGKVPSFKRMMETDLSDSDPILAAQVNENPGLLVRLHPDVRSFILPDLLG